MSRTTKEKVKVDEGTPESVEIMRLLLRGYDNERIFDCIAPPQAFPEATMRQRRAKTKKHVKFDKEERERLLSLINVLRSQ